jgi:hypothetical protein
MPRLPRFIKVPLQFVAKNVGWSINFAASWTLFGIYGIPAWVQDGYYNQYGPDGNVPSGPKGSGVLPVSFGLVLASTAVYAVIILNYRPPSTEDELHVIGLEGFGAGDLPSDLMPIEPEDSGAPEPGAHAIIDSIPQVRSFRDKAEELGGAVGASLRESVRSFKHD